MTRFLQNLLTKVEKSVVLQRGDIDNVSYHLIYSQDYDKWIERHRKRPVIDVVYYHDINKRVEIILDNEFGPFNVGDIIIVPSFSGPPAVPSWSIMKKAFDGQKSRGEVFYNLDFYFVYKINGAESKAVHYLDFDWSAPYGSGYSFDERGTIDKKLAFEITTKKGPKSYIEMKWATEIHHLQFGLDKIPFLRCLESCKTMSNKYLKIETRGRFYELDI